MEVVQPLHPMSRSLLRPDDPSRLPRGTRLDEHERPRASSEDTRLNGDRALNGTTASPLVDSPSREDYQSAQAAVSGSGTILLSLDETTELFRSRVEDARQDTEHALAGSTDVDEAVKPKLTLDLGHSNIARLPESVVDLIKTEVERLSLSHNQIWHIPLRFAECSHLRYLNIRSNVFREIPRGVYKLPLLEILDISRNKVRKISKEIKNLTSLRVFSIVHNRIDDLPPEMCEMTKLQILKVAENPLRFKLKKIIEAKEAEVAYSEMTDNERETAVTSEIKRHLRECHPMVISMDVESGGEMSEGPAETPRPLKRVVSSRFPVIPSGTSSEITSDSLTRSPNQGRPPPIPTRSHYRIASGQSGSGMRRPSLAPIMSNNERNRSNSESVLQASAAARNKRMGMLRKGKSDLDPVEELKSNRHSHLRGFSHGSVLRSRSGSIVSPGGPHSASPNSPRDNRRHRVDFVKRLSSLPEHKRDDDWRNPVIEGAKGILYALYQIHPHISSLIAAVTGRKDARRSSLETIFFNASIHVDRLNEVLEMADSLDAEDEDALEKAEANVHRDCSTCVMAYTHVTVQLQDNVSRIVAGTDEKYVRTLMILLYGSMIELKNAICNFGIEVETEKQTPAIAPLSQVADVPDKLSMPPQPRRTATPTRDRALMMSRPAPRLRSDTTIKHPIWEEMMPPNPPFAQEKFPSRGNSQPPTPLTGNTLQGGAYHKSMPSFASSDSNPKSTVSSSVGLRSRSNSRNTNTLTQSSSSMVSSLAGTPQSVEGFHLPSPNLFSSRINPATGLTDAQEESLFEQIFLALTRSYDFALKTVPIVRRQFTRYLEVAEENRQPKEVRELWSTLIWRCKSCLDASENLKARLINMRLKDPVVTVNGAGSGRNDPAFWQLCTTFLKNFIELATEMKEARDLRMLAQEIVVVLRPVHKASREASRLVDTSPWRHLADSGASSVQLATPYNVHSAVTTSNSHSNGVNGNAFTGYSQALQQHQMYQSPFPPPVIPIPPVPTSSATMLSGASPVSVPLPATPLSAALGPAAQATIPSTPANAYTDQFFAGNVFQRADSLLSMPQAGGINFLNRR